MSKTSIFDIDKMICPWCHKTHPVKRHQFNLYSFHCPIQLKQIDFVVNNWRPKDILHSYWKRWL